MKLILLIAFAVVATVLLAPVLYLFLEVLIHLSLLVGLLICICGVVASFVTYIVHQIESRMLSDEDKYGIEASDEPLPPLPLAGSHLCTKNRAKPYKHRAS